MAKSKKQNVTELRCTETGITVYVRGRNTQGKEKLELRKFNKKLRKHTLFKEKR